MPKRSNEFQKVIMLLKKHAAPLNATVTESKLLRDLITGADREVDICVDHVVAGHPIIISIECVDRKRPATVEWVEQMKSKHERLETNALILVSKSGFSKQAISVAEKSKISALKLEEFNDESSERIFKDTNSLWFKAFTLIPKKVVFKVRLNENSTENVVVDHDTQIFSNQDIEMGTVKEAVNSILRLKEVTIDLQKKGLGNHNFFEIGYEPGITQTGEYINLKHLELNELRKIELIHITGKVKPYISEFPLTQGKVGEDRIAWGKGEIFNEEALIVSSEDDEGNIRLSIKTDKRG